MSAIYELPGFGEGTTNAILGGWQISAIVQARSGEALRITQPSGIDRSRVDVVPGADLVFADWKDTCTATGCNYLDRNGFALVPTSSVTSATLRPGTYMMDMARGPGRLDTNMTIAKSFGIGGGNRLQVRMDMFNALNYMNLSNPQQAINNANFGRITGAGGARVLQFGARMTF